ncbi:hypothetical protein NZ698_14890 [Chryseobacterium sp. PBS4-4]|uniref:DUF4238 domain-containing protein n=1 Tax=Chryseobacterium edaphi TaxID=2976532 RepID=A0ABT2WCY8_9FLAO|nr:hypothetical protein [Chryseobacterium edaphi]MCU7618485.1 hypothetical protein [Chryseobacterium edaphi]
MNIVFLKYISSKKKYIFRLVNGQSDRIDFLEMRVYFNRKFMTCTLKSVHDQSLFEKDLPFHSDGFFNRHTFLFNSNPIDSWFPESVTYRFEHSAESLTECLSQISQDLTNQGRSFFTTDVELSPIFLLGRNYIDELQVDKDQLASELQYETDIGRFFKMIENETYKDLIDHLSEVWIFPKEDDLRDYSLEDKKYYFAFNLLYYHINQGRKKVIRNSIYRDQ